MVTKGGTQLIWEGTYTFQVVSNSISIPARCVVFFSISLCENFVRGHTVADRYYGNGLTSIVSLLLPVPYNISLTKEHTLSEKHMGLQYGSETWIQT